MDLNALFKISHGLYVIGAKDENNRWVGSCIDAVMVIEVNPCQIMISLGKNSYTCETFLKTKALSLSVLPEHTPFNTIARFGFQSSRTTDKWKKETLFEKEGLPFLKNACAYMHLKQNTVLETATHYVFLCDVISCVAGECDAELTYNAYQKNIKKKEKTMTQQTKWICSVCGYVYDGETPFEELPDDWVCPLCGELKSVFVREE